jgi:hypothetical protein
MKKLTIETNEIIDEIGGIETDERLVRRAKSGSGGLEMVQIRRDAGVHWSSSGGVTTGHSV